MKQELETYLVIKYPEIFKGRYETPQKNLMCFGFSCDDGWFHIIDNACSLIVGRQQQIKERNETHAEWLELCKKGEFISEYVQGLYSTGALNKPEPIPSFTATQIKEKYGTLRFYYSGGDDYINGIIAYAESMSQTTCEICGDKGLLRGFGWVKTTCDKHKHSNELTEEEYYNSFEQGTYITVLKKSGSTKEMMILQKNDDETFIMEETIYMWKCNPNTDLHHKARLIRTPVFTYMMEID